MYGALGGFVNLFYFDLKMKYSDILELSHSMEAMNSTEFLQFVENQLSLFSPKSLSEVPSKEQELQLLLEIVTNHEVDRNEIMMKADVCEAFLLQSSKCTCKKFVSKLNTSMKLQIFKNQTLSRCS